MIDKIKTLYNTLSVEQKNDFKDDVVKRFNAAPSTVGTTWFVKWFIPKAKQQPIYDMLEQITQTATA